MNETITQWRLSIRLDLYLKQYLENYIQKDHFSRQTWATKATKPGEGIITSDRQRQLRLSSAKVFAENSDVAPAGISKEPATNRISAA